jgi:hypothetical protein
MSILSSTFKMAETFCRERDFSRLTKSREKAPLGTRFPTTVKDSEERIDPAGRGEAPNRGVQK